MMSIENKVVSGYGIRWIGAAMVRLWRLVISGLVLVSLAVLPLSAQGARGATEGSSFRPDYPAVNLEIQKFEARVNKTILGVFDNNRTVMTGIAKGAYLQGYGLALSFTVNIYRGMLETPFGRVQTDDMTPDQKRRRVEDLKEKLSRILFETGANLKQIRGEDTIAIIGFIEDRNFLGEPNQSKTVVLSVLKRDLDDASHKEDPWKEFKSRMKIVEY
jgi:hypothetical protein